MIEKRKLSLEPLEPRGPWQAFLMPVTEFPVPVAQRATLLAFAGPLLESLRRSNHDHMVFLQSWKLGRDSGASLLADHHRDWRPQVGLGVWPDRKPPRGWTEESMMDAAAAVIRGDEPEMPWNHLLRLRPNTQSRENADHALRGFGAQIDVFTTSAPDDLLAECRTYYLTRIDQDRFRDQPFYAPLIDRRGFEGASVADLDKWMCGIDLYLRESAEDRAVLLITRLPLRQVLGDAGLLSTEPKDVR